MATIQTIGKAQAYGLAIKKITGVDPSYDYGDNHVRIYFQPDRLKEVQDKLQEWETSEPGDVRIDWFPAIVPIAARKAIPIAAGIFFLGYILGKR